MLSENNSLIIARSAKTNRTPKPRINIPTPKMRITENPCVVKPFDSLLSLAKPIDCVAA
jgi:hypothetical protein